MRDEGADPDGALFRRFAEGDAAAFDALLRKHGRTVWSFTRRFLGARGAAEDVYQEVWLRVIKSAASFEGRSRFTTWLYQVTRSVCIDHLRSDRRRRDRIPIDESGERAQDLEDQGPRASDDAERRELVSAIEQAVAALPEEQREVFLLRETTGLTFEEIGRLTGASTNTVKSRMRYALENVRRALGPRAGAKEKGS